VVEAAVVTEAVVEPVALELELLYLLRLAQTTQLL
jgi:hypothetical protein